MRAWSGRKSLRLVGDAPPSCAARSRGRDPFGEDHLADAVVLTRHLEELVVGEEFDGVIERQIRTSIQADSDVAIAACACWTGACGERRSPRDRVADVLADDHAHVDLDAGVDEDWPRSCACARPNVVVSPSSHAMSDPRYRESMSPAYGP